MKMTPEQFEALKAWVEELRDYAVMEAIQPTQTHDYFLSVRRAEERARKLLVEDGITLPVEIKPINQDR